MSSFNEGRPLPELIGGLATDITTLFRKEIELAKAEASEKAGKVLGGLEMLIAGGVLALGALGVLLSALVSAIAAFFVSQGMGQTGAESLAAVIVGVIIAIGAFVLISRGLAAFKASNFQLNRTASSLSRDAAMVKERL